MSTFETIYIIGHAIGSFLLLMVQFFVVKNYVVPFAKKVYHFVIDGAISILQTKRRNSMQR